MGRGEKPTARSSLNTSRAAVAAAAKEKTKRETRAAGPSPELSGIVMFSSAHAYVVVGDIIQYIYIYTCI